MGNVTTKSVGNFQANVGVFSADVNVIVSYVIAGILILIAIGLAITAFIPMKPWDCDDLQGLKDTDKTMCNPGGPGGPGGPTGSVFDEACKDAKADYNKEEKRCNTKVKQTWLLWFLLLIPLAILIVLFSKYWDHLVHSNKTAAQVGGTMFELNTLKNFMKN